VTERSDPAVEANPFSTRHVRPGAIPYLFPEGEDAATLLARLERSAWRGQIVGPHGSGKSALLATLVAALETRGKPVLPVTLHDGARKIPGGLDALQAERGTLVIIDGYEQLAFWNRLLLRRHCRRRGLGLLVTAHRSVGFPQLFRTTTSIALAEQLANRLLGGRPLPLDRAELRQQFDEHQGNLREVFFSLYDAYERGRKRALW